MAFLLGGLVYMGQYRLLVHRVCPEAPWRGKGKLLSTKLLNLWPFFLVVWYTGASTEYSCTESDHRHHGEERESSFQLNYLIYGLSSWWFGIQGPVPSTRAQSLTIGTMARKRKAPFQLNYLIYALSSRWSGIQGPVRSTGAQSLTIGSMARKGKAPFN